MSSCIASEGRDEGAFWQLGEWVEAHDAAIKGGGKEDPFGGHCGEAWLERSKVHRLGR